MLSKIFIFIKKTNITTRSTKLQQCEIDYKGNFSCPDKGRLWLST